jgi:hypothetical protein
MIKPLILFLIILSTSAFGQITLKVDFQTGKDEQIEI